MTQPSTPRAAAAYELIADLGIGVRGAIVSVAESVAYVGGVSRLLLTVTQHWFAQMTFAARFRGRALVEQMVRVGVKSIPIVVLVQVFIGIILALNMAPTLQQYGQLDRVADIVAIAIFRELGALISAIILSGFAGASIAAELGTMVEGEEIKALRAHALDPIPFLVVPRVVATTVMLVGLTIIADVMGVFGGLLTGVFVLDVNARVYIESTRHAVDLNDYMTGLMKAAVFGAIIAGLACYEGLGVKGGAAGVGRATTTTVVKSIVALIGADVVFTAIFYSLGW